MDCALAIIAGGRPVKQVCDVLGVARSNMAAKLARPADWRDGRSARKTDDASLVEEIRLAIADLPSYGYRRVWGVVAIVLQVEGMPLEGLSLSFAATVAKCASDLT